MLRLARSLEPLGVEVVRFDFPSRDPMAVLKGFFLEVLHTVKKEHSTSKLLIGGRSMGGRVASMLAADGFACDGLLLAAYPLHPAGQPGKLRDAHLPLIRCPVLCLNGTRDALCRRDLMDDVLKTVRAPWTMHWLEGADHSFRVLKSSGRSEADVDAEVGEAAKQWLSRL